ncbi:MAG: LCP family protein [Erysipelotrichaceae bacterium]|nr:LCP family protein [Erysipelotrichaceae bacterium]
MKKKKKKGLRWGRIFLALFLVLVLITSIVGAGIYFYIDYRLDHGKNTYIAIIGTDERPNQQDLQRSDVLMFASVNFQTSEVNLISLPRDSLVEIPCRTNGSADKITHAYHYGGRECTIETLKQLFEVDEIPNYVQLNFDSLIALVDDLGGITLTPTRTFCEFNVDKSEKYCFEKGVTITNMNGAQALAYSRHRKTDSDIYRTKRQQEVMMAMLAKAKKMDLPQVYRLGKKVLAEIDTNIDLFEVLTYFRLVMRDDFSLHRTSAEGSDYYYGGIYYYQLDDEWVEQIRQQIK